MIGSTLAGGLYALGGLLLVGFLVGELRRGDTHIAGIYSTREHSPILYWTWWW